MDEGAEDVVTGDAGAEALAAAGDEDIPDTALAALPSEVVITPVSVGATFSVECEVDLRKLTFALRNCEYNPRRHSSAILRLQVPRLTASIFKCGTVSILASKNTEDALRQAARKIARMVQKCDHPAASCGNFRLRNYKAKADLRFPVRLEGLAKKWSRHVMYEPEVSHKAHFYIKNPRCTLSISASGNVMFSAVENIDETHEALRKTYLLLREFSV